MKKKFREKLRNEKNSFVELKNEKKIDSRKGKKKKKWIRENFYGS
jgi:hypothetical protein